MTTIERESRYWLTAQVGRREQELFAHEVHANHCEALNSSIRRHYSADRRRQNHYAKTRSGLQRAITVQQLIHNWIRPHCSFSKKTTPAMKMGLILRPVTRLEFLTRRGYSSVTS